MRWFLIAFCAAALLFAPAVFAEEKPCNCWIDAKTGKKVPTKPMGGMHSARTPGTGAEYPEDDVHMGPGPDHAFNTKTGQNYVRETNGCWIDAKTGKKVSTKPMGGMHSARTPGSGAEYPEDDVHMGPGSDHAFNTKTGQNYVREPCPPPGQATGETLKKVFDSVHIGIGIGGGYTSGHDEHHHGEDRHRTAEKVSTDKTKTHKTSPTTTHKTVTSACKCHPCTCSPCTCH